MFKKKNHFCRNNFIILKFLLPYFIVKIAKIVNFPKCMIRKLFFLFTMSFFYFINIIQGNSFLKSNLEESVITRLSCIYKNRPQNKPSYRSVYKCKYFTDFLCVDIRNSSLALTNTKYSYTQLYQFIYSKCQTMASGKKLKVWGEVLSNWYKIILIICIIWTLMRCKFYLICPGDVQNVN